MSAYSKQPHAAANQSAGGVADAAQARRIRMRRLAMNGLFLAMALVLSVLERWIPVQAVIPIPGVKLGLANIITLFILFYADWVDAAVVSALRCLLAAFAFAGSRPCCSPCPARRWPCRP
jgi:predicted membrane protein